MKLEILLISWTSEFLFIIIMYKHLFRAVLWVIWILGILSLWIADATDVTITYNLSGGYRVEDGTTWAKQVQFTTDANGMVWTTDRKTPSRGDECEENGVMKKCMFEGWHLENGARWTWYADSDMTVYARRLPFEDMVLTLSWTSFTIMDRNLWATASWITCVYDSGEQPDCGYHFQWWNNYGFDFDVSLSPANGEMLNLETATDREWHTSTYYNWILRDQNPWNSWAKNNDNLWWWWDVLNSEIDRQWPCPYWYHIPDTLERQRVWKILKAWTYWMVTAMNTLRLPRAGSYIKWSFYSARSSWGEYWSSTPWYNTLWDIGWYILYLGSLGSYLDWKGISWRSTLNSVRCFKNSPTKILTFLFRDNVLEKKEIRRWEPMSESYAPLEITGNTNVEILGRFLDSNGNEAFTFSPDTYIEQDTTLYAKYQCKNWYIENEAQTGCEKIRVEFDANGWSFWNENLKIVESNVKNNPKSTIKYSHTPNIDDEWNRNWDYPPGLDLNEAVTITWATNLHVKLRCDFRMLFYPPGRPSYMGGVSVLVTKYPNYMLPMDLCWKEYDVEWDTVIFTCWTSSDWGNSWDGYWYYAMIEWTGSYVEYPDDAFDNVPEPTREWHKFKWWYLSGGAEFDSWNVSTGEITKVYAKWECAQWYVDKQWQCVKEETRPSWWSSGWWGGWGWWGSSSSSCKNLPTNAVANNNSTPSSNTNYYYSTNTSKVCTFQCKSGYTRNAEKETCDKASDSQTTTWTTVKEPEGTWNNTKVEIWNNTEIQTWSKIDTPEQTHQNDNSNTQDSSTSSQNDGKTYTQEFQEAYEFAKWNGITTMPTIQKANMEWKLTRIAMAKMLSQYAMNVLWQKPANIVTPKFNDVTDKQNSDYDDWVTLAYQLWIMWQNMPNNKFRPNDEVTRAEFATALSRMLYHTSDWEYKSTDKYYTNHMKKLVQEWIITKDDPKMKELRCYVMIMLMRSAK